MATGGSINTDILSDETFDLLCSICKRKGKHCEAEKYCVECNTYYCLVCVKVHEDVPLLSGHKILDKDQFKTSKGLSASQQGSGQTPTAALTERCNKHNHYYVDMYCETHDDVGCATCIATDHRSCTDTFYIPDFLKDNVATPGDKVIAQILERVAEIDEILTKSHNTLQHEKQKLLKAKEDTLKNIRKFREDINDRLDKLEQNSVNEIESLYKALFEEIEKATKEVQTNHSNIKSAQNKLASPGNNVSQAFVNAKNGSKTAKMAAKWIAEKKTQLHVVDIDFQADQRLSKLLEEINTLGNVTKRNIKDEGTMASSASDLQDQQVTSSQSTKHKKYPATSDTIQQRNDLLCGSRKKNYNLEVMSDQSICHIISACALEDGTIILSDNNNNKLKCLHSSTYTVTDYCDLPVKPWQVCAISKQEVAVCLSDKLRVQFISVGTKMAETRKINTDCRCFGLAYANDRVYISDFNTSVYMYSITGINLKQFSLEQKRWGFSLVPYASIVPDIHGLAVSKDGSRIYVADFYRGLIVLDDNGKVVEQFNDPQLKYAYGCYLTEKGNLLVCGKNSHNVLQFGPDGELIGEVVKSNKNKAVCCNQQASKLIVGKKSNEIEVYDLA